MGCNFGGLSGKAQSKRADCIAIAGKLHETKGDNPRAKSCMSGKLKLFRLSALARCATMATMYNLKNYLATFANHQSHFAATKFARRVRLCLVTALVVAAGLITNTAGAANVTVDLYTVNIDVDNESVDIRKKAASEALEVVYRRVTGSSEPLAYYPGLKSYLSRASRYLSTYAYRSEERPGQTTGSTIDGEEVDSLDSLLSQRETPPASLDKQLVLVMQFDPASIKQQLSDSGAPRWAARRPQLDTVVLVREAEAEPSLVKPGSVDTAGYTSILRFFAKDLGLPINTRAASDFSANTLWPASVSELRSKAASREDAVLFGKIDVVQQIARWTFVWGDVFYTQQTTAESEAALIKQGLEIAQQQFATRLANRVSTQHAGVGRALGMTVVEVNSIEQYFALLAYLDSLEVLRGYAITEFSGNTLSLQFNTSASSENLRRSLSLDNRLVVLDAQSLVYRWR